MAHTIVKARKISNVSANIEYLQDTKKHPELCHSYSTCSMELWQEYALVNQEAFAGSGQSGKCVEAHELIFVCPEEFYRLSEPARVKMANGIADRFKKKHDVEVLISLHGSDSDSRNMHMHLMYMERRLQPELEKIAKRNMYFDAEGRQVRAKKDALDQEGNLLPGYRFVKKGDCYGRKTWTAKEKYLRGKKFTEETKEWWTGIINDQRKYEWASDMEEREVYNRKTSPYLPMQGLPAPLKYSKSEKQEAANKAYEEYVQDIKACNELRKEYNKTVSIALENGADLEELVEHRKQLSASLYLETQIDHSRTRSILDKALEWIKGILDLLKPLESILNPFKAAKGTNTLSEPKTRKSGIMELIEAARADVDAQSRHVPDIRYSGSVAKKKEPEH